MTITDLVPPDPRQPWRVRLRLMWVIVAPALIAAGIWAFKPIVRSESAFDASIDRKSPRSPGARQDSSDIESIDAGTFAVNLWNPPPVAEPAKAIAEKSAPPPKPLNIQLIGIITEDGIAKAALYDVDTDRLLIVADGEMIQDRTVRIVRGDQTTDGERGAGVEISDGRSKQMILLRPKEGGQS